MIRFLKYPLIFIVLVGIIYGMLPTILRQMIYPSPPVAVPLTAPQGLSEERLLLKTGETVIIWHNLRQQSTPNSPTLIFFHGNGENLQTMALSGTLGQLDLTGVPFAALDYPGYGRSSGQPGEASLSAAGVAIVEWAGEERAGARLILAGWSLGAGVAAQVASRVPEKIDGLILMSPWTSLRDVAKVHYPGWMVERLLHESYDSRAIVGQLGMPMMIIHGEDDSIIPVSQGKQLAGIAGAKLRWTPVKGAGHNDLLGRPEVWKAIRDFIDPH